MRMARLYITRAPAYLEVAVSTQKTSVYETISQDQFVKTQHSQTFDITLEGKN